MRKEQVVQADDFSITVTCADTSNKLHLVRIKPGRKLHDRLNADEITQMKSVAGSLQWITRNCRPTIAYRVSKIQSASNASGCIRDIKSANKVVDYALATAEEGLTFRSGVLDWDNLVMGVITDASFANETEVVAVPGQEQQEAVTESHRSQGGKLLTLMSPDILTGESCHFHLI